MQRKCRIIMTLSLVLFFTLPAWAAVYTWKDKDGNTVVSSSPPPPGVATEKVGQEKESVRTEEDKPAAKEQAPMLRSKGLLQPLPARSREGTQTNQQRVNREQRAYRDIRVTMYRTEWCPYCKKANEYLNSLGVTLIEYDIERDRGKAEEMRNKGGNGVPLVDVEGIIIKGYNTGAMKEAVEKKRNGG